MRHFLLCLLLVGCQTKALPSSSLPGSSPPCSPHPPQDLLTLINQERATYHHFPLRPDPYLQTYATNHAQWMADHHVLRHSSLQTLLGTDFYNASLGEVIAQAPTAEAAFAAWLHSPGHRHVLMAAYYDRFGLGVSQDPSGQKWWCVIVAADRLP